MAGKNRRRRKKKPTPLTPNVEPTSPPLASTATTNDETSQPHTDDVLKAETIMESVSLMLELQQKKIESLIQLHNANQSLGAEMVKLMRENEDCKRENEHWKQEIENWKKESTVIKTSIVWAEARGCTHLNGRILEDLNDFRWHILNCKEKQLQQILEQMDRLVDNPEKRQANRKKYSEDNKATLQALGRMRAIAEAVTKKQQIQTWVGQCSEQASAVGNAQEDGKLRD